MDLTTSKFYESRDIVFHEHIFPFAVSAKDKTASFVLNLAQNVDVVDDEIDQVVTQNFVNDSMQSIPIEIPQPLKRSIRQHKLPSHLNDYACCSNTHDNTSICCCTLTNLGVCPKDNSRVTVATAFPPIVEP